MTGIRQWSSDALGYGLWAVLIGLVDYGVPLACLAAGVAGVGGTLAFVGYIGG